MAKGQGERPEVQDVVGNSQKNGQGPWQAAGNRLAEPMGRRLLGAAPKS